jgi:hypothetical protein
MIKIQIIYVYTWMKLISPLINVYLWEEYFLILSNITNKKSNFVLFNYIFVYIQSNILITIQLNLNEFGKYN